jgi:hypothetical protein
MKATLLLMPAGLLIVAAVIVNAVTNPQVSLFVGWLFCALAALAVVTMASPLEDEVGRLDAAQIFTAAWFVLLSSSMTAGSLWNTSIWVPPAEMRAFVKVPADVWVLAGVTLGANLGVRIAFSLNKNLNRSNLKTGDRLQQLFMSPLDMQGKPNMAIAQYVLMNVVAIVVYAVAIFQLFYSIGEKIPVPDFPTIPAEVLSLIGVSAGGFLVANSIPRE